MLLIMMTLFLAPRGKQPPQNYPQTAILSKMSFIANNDYSSGLPYILSICSIYGLQLQLGDPTLQPLGFLGHPCTPSDSQKV